MKRIRLLWHLENLEEVKNVNESPQLRVVYARIEIRNWPFECLNQKPNRERNFVIKEDFTQRLIDESYSQSELPSIFVKLENYMERQLKYEKESKRPFITRLYIS